MIDLDRALSELVDLAPEPPDVASVIRRGGLRQAQRRSRRRSAAIVLTAVVVIAAAVFVAAGRSHQPRLYVSPTPGTGATVEHLRVTLLDGSQLDVAAPRSLGLTRQTAVLNAAIGPSDNPGWGTVGHGFVVTGAQPQGLGAVVAHYLTADGSDLVVHRTASGQTAVVHYSGWWLVSSWPIDRANPAPQWAPFAAALDAKVGADGYLVVEPATPGWTFHLPDAPDVQLGGDPAKASAIAFFGPRGYPGDCPAPSADSTEHTAQGWPVKRAASTTSWCDRDVRIGVAVWDQHLVAIALQELRVSYNAPAHVSEQITTLDGTILDIAAPSTVLDQIALQGGVWVEGIDTPNVINETPNVLPLIATRALLPSGAAEPSYPTADNHRFYSFHNGGECQCDELVASYGDWMIEIIVQRSGAGPTMSHADRARVAALFRATTTTDDFVVLDPLPAMRWRSGPDPGADVVLDGVDVFSPSTGCDHNSVEMHTPQGYPVHITGDVELWCDPTNNVTVIGRNDPDHKLIEEIQITRVG